MDSKEEEFEIDFDINVIITMLTNANTEQVTIRRVTLLKMMQYVERLRADHRFLTELVNDQTELIRLLKDGSS